MAQEIKDLPLDRVFRNEEQPRQDFPAEHINALAASIRENGLLQPITVRPMADGTFQIVAGECRTRACKQLGLATIKAIVVEIDETDRDILAIIENLQRRDVTVIEQARAYQRMLSQGWTVEDLAKRLGIAPYRVTERTQLLNARREYQDLTASGQLSPLQAWYLSKLSPHSQDRLFRAIKEGRVDTAEKLKALYEALAAAEQQMGMFADAETGKLSEEEEDKVNRLEKKIEAIAAMVAGGFNKDGGVEIARKVAAHRAKDMADKLDLISAAIGHLTKDLRKAAAQLELAA